MVNELISVIIPVYNVEKYLAKCIQSVIDQTYKNLEIILVNDGATDLSGKICDEYVSKDSRIICVHKQNGGLSDARNAGIEKMMGKYVSFVDSDDFIDTRFIEVLYNNLIISDADISISNFERVKEGEFPTQLNSKIDCTFSSFNRIESLNALYINELKYQFTTAWGKLYKASLFRDIRFPKGRNYEDTATSHRVLDKAHKVVYTNRKQYFYLIRETSITKSEKYIKDDAILAVRDRIQYFEKHGYDDLLVKAKMEYITTLMGMYARLPLVDTDADTRRKEIYNKVKLCIKANGKIIESNMGFRCRVCFFTIFPKIYTCIIAGTKKQ